MDPRFVLVEIGKLTASVERLVLDVSKLSISVQELRNNVSFVKGAAWVIGGLIVVCTAIVSLIASGKVTIGFH